MPAGTASVTAHLAFDGPGSVSLRLAEPVLATLGISSPIAGERAAEDVSLVRPILMGKVGALAIEAEEWAAIGYGVMASFEWGNWRLVVHGCANPGLTITRNAAVNRCLSGGGRRAALAPPASITKAPSAGSATRRPKPAPILSSAAPGRCCNSRQPTMRPGTPARAAGEAGRTPTASRSVSRSSTPASCSARRPTLNAAKGISEAHSIVAQSATC